MKIGKDIREMNLARFMGAVSFLVTESLIVLGFIRIESRDIVGLITVQAGVFFTIFAAVTGKNIIDLKRNGTQSCSNGSKQIPAM